MNTTASPGAALGFVPLAQEAFSFLSGVGFKVAQHDDSLVRFESERVVLSVFQGRSSYTIGAELGRVNERERYTLFEVVSHVAPARTDEVRCQATRADVLERCLLSIASVLNQECQDLLRGQDDAYQDLSTGVSALRRAATLQAEYGAILDRADRAWEQNERDLAADLYESAEPALDETRRRRFSYVRSRQT